MDKGTAWSGPRTAQVVPLLRLHALGDRRFDYLVPQELSERVEVGSVVGVRFGKRSARAVVVGLDQPEADTTVELRTIESVEDRSVPADLLVLAEHLAAHYIAPLEACLRLVVPPAPGKTHDPRRHAAAGWAFRCDPEDGSAGEGSESRLTAKQTRLLHLIPGAGVPWKEVCSGAGVGKSVLVALVDKGLVRLGEEPREGSESRREGDFGHDGLWPILSSEQEEAVLELAASLEAKTPVARQLWGVTGSGKTEVYLHLTRMVLSRGGGVILLVPEIALTPQMISRVSARFGESVGVLHSGLTLAQRREQYGRIADGHARVVIGARSAVFAPVRGVNLIVIDESHDTSYKQEESPGYHARTVALSRLEAGGGLLLEGSASPAVEAMRDLGSWVRMPSRARGSLPDCEVVDMRHRSGSGVLASVTREALAETVRRGEQAIVLLNRRGYSGHVHCDTCGHVMMCTECELSLTYHNQSKRLVCHHCGRSYVQPSICPECQKAPLARGGPGTERLSEEITHLVSKDKVYRLDSDVLTSGARVRTVLESFAASRPGVLVGTQMVAKGHDFPDVTLVVVADADMGLYVPDFRAAERTFQLLTQVSGRAGRAERPGRVMVQTWNPDVPCIRMALDRDDEAFYLREAAVRERLGYPPFTELVRLVLAGEQAPVVQKAATHLADRLGQHFPESEVRGPVRLVTLRGRSRWHIVVSSKDGDRTRSIVSQAVAQLGAPYGMRGVKLLVDVDPFAFI